MHIRPASLSDADAIAAIHVTAWQHTYRGAMPQALLDGLSVAGRAAQWRTRLAQPSPGRISLVIEQDGAVVGFASVGPARGEPTAGELYAIYLRPDCIGIGAGRRLLAAASDTLVAAGFTEALLWVLRDNPRARRVYEAAGWRPDGGEKVEDFGGQELVEVCYRLDLCTQT